MKKLLVFVFISMFCTVFLLAHTQKDTLYTIKATIAPVIDGNASDACWDKAAWFPIDQVWLPFGQKMKAGDFEGRYKLSWDKDYLYVLVEVVDDSLSDDTTDPLQNWWADDCVEIFFDENRSKGDHLNNYNAFAYHVSTLYDVVDMGTDGAQHLYNDNLEVKMDTIGPHKYLWEFGIKVYTSAYDINDPETSRISLTHGKVMGFSIAYCDNDETKDRENFIGSINMTASNSNDNYKTANYFGTCKLIDSETEIPTGISQISKSSVTIYPNPASDFLEINSGKTSLKSVKLISVLGKVETFKEFNPVLKSTYNLSLAGNHKGLYFIELMDVNGTVTLQKLVIK